MGSLWGCSGVCAAKTAARTCETALRYRTPQDSIKKTAVTTILRCYYRTCSLTCE